MDQISVSFIQGASRPAKVAYRVCFVAALLVAGGCATLGERMSGSDRVSGVPSMKEILFGLAANEAALTSFRATGTAMLQLPEVEATQVSRESVLYFQQPGDLHVVGRRYGTRFVELTYSRNAFLIEFPTRRQYCYRPAGERFSSLTSADIAREMLQPEIWRTIFPERLRLRAYDPDTQTGLLEVLRESGKQMPERVVKVQGKPWVVLENRLMDEEGTPIAITTKGEYHEMNGVRYPTWMESVFPREGAWMRFQMRNMTVNQPVDEALFDIPARVRQLQRRGFAQVDLFSENELNLEGLLE